MGMNAVKTAALRPLAVGILMILIAAAQGSAEGTGTATNPAAAPATGAASNSGTNSGVVILPSSMLGADFDPTQYIGQDLKSALDSLGAPKEVFTFRGHDDAQDNVVFFYPDFLYLFWYRNKVWQVRCDRRFAKPLFGFAMGMPREVIERTSARHFTAVGDSLYFDLDDAKYPMRVRLVFASGALIDLYVYRSDF